MRANSGLLSKQWLHFDKSVKSIYSFHRNGTKRGWQNKPKLETMKGLVRHVEEFDYFKDNGMSEEEFKKEEMTYSYA